MYFRKFIEAYDKEGIEIYMVSPQNEPTMWTLYSSCRWTGVQLCDFLKYLGPQMEELGVQIYLGTFTNSDDSLMDPTLNDVEARKYISGINFQWWSYNKARSLFHTGFQQGMMQSETMCGNGNNDWQYAEYQFDVMYMYFSYGISAYNMCNMVLEWDGENPGGYNTATPPWPQNAPITVNETTKKYSINPQYYNIKHYSDAVKANARRIKSSGTYDQECIPGTNAKDNAGDGEYSAEQREIAFRNADGTISLLVKNAGNSVKNVDINFNGRKVTAESPAHSINTFTIQGTPLTGNETDMRQILPKDKIVTIKNAETGKALCIDGGEANTLAEIIPWDYSGQANQQWYLQPDKVGTQDTVKLLNVKSFHLAAVDAGSTADGTRLIIWNDTKGDDQNWIMETSGEYVKFKNAKSGLYMAFGKNDKGKDLAVQTAASDSNLQKWKVEAAYAMEGDMQVDAVSITPGTSTAAKGGTRQFTAAVTGANNPPATVDWTIDGNKSYGTKINRKGLLFVANDETAESITVRATATWDNTKYMKVSVKVEGNGKQGIESVSITPKTASVQTGKTKQFKAQVDVKGGAPQTITWSVSGNKSSKTKISSAGVLTVAADETSSRLSVKAESVFDKAKHDTAIVTVTKAVKPVPGKNSTHKIGKLYYKVTKSAAKNGTVTVTRPVRKTYTSVAIPATVSINGYTFKVTAIGNKAFYKNTKLKKITVGNNVARIGTSAFASNKKLTSVTLGSGITTIDSKVFYQDSRLKTVKLKSKKLKTVKKQAFKGIAGKAKVDVPNNRAKSYKKLLKKAGLPAKASVK